MAIVRRAAKPTSIRHEEQAQALTAMRKSTEVADVLKAATMSYFIKRGFSCYDELGLTSWGKLRADVISVNLRGVINICEVKSCPADYKADKKWKQYLEYADRFYFVMSHGTYQKLEARLKIDLQGTGAGVMVLNPSTGWLEVKKPAKEQDLSDEVRSSLVTRMAWRGGASKRTFRRTRHYIEQEAIVHEDQEEKAPRTVRANSRDAGRNLRTDRPAASVRPKRRKKKRRAKEVTI